MRLAGVTYIHILGTHLLVIEVSESHRHRHTILGKCSLVGEVSKGCRHRHTRIGRHSLVSQIGDGAGIDTLE